MRISRCLLAAIALVSASTPTLAASPEPSGDTGAINALLDTYTSAVTHKDEARFEALLVGTDIPFAYVDANPTGQGAAKWRDYASFRRYVFQGPPFTQTFRDVHIRQHGALADVDLVYLNDDGHGAHPGWKTMQLIRIDGQWKIASEFFTGLPDDAK